MPPQKQLQLAFSRRFLHDDNAQLKNVILFQLLVFCQSINIATASENPEKQLVALRAHLLALGRTEGQLKELREKAIATLPKPTASTADNNAMSTNTITTTTTTTEYSIVEVLTLWQTIFQQTFHEYHRLSARLVQTQDSASALRLWQEYLHHVQTFLSTDIPVDYASLTEHRHLCEVHQNLLTSQQSVLAMNVDEEQPTSDADANAAETTPSSSTIPEVPATSAYTAERAAVREQFIHLTGLHNETLSRILDRHTEIQMRLGAWDQYRDGQRQLLDWLREREQERGRLQLRYIHLRRVPKILQRVERLLEQMPHGEAETEALRALQPQFLPGCDEALATSVRMELAAIVQRVANMRSALETWRDFLVRIGQLHGSYEMRVQLVQQHVRDVQSILARWTHATTSPAPCTVGDVQMALRELRSQRVRLNNLTPELEACNVVQEELKECVSPFDMKTVRQMVWLLWQQQADLDQQLAGLINRIEERIALKDTFNSKYDRLSAWMDGLEARLTANSNSKLSGSIAGQQQQQQPDSSDAAQTTAMLLRDSDDVLRRRERELRSEMELRERERDWLLVNGQELLTFYTTPSNGDADGDGLASATTAADSESEQQRVEIQTKLDTIAERWERLRYLCQSRTNKVRDLKTTIVRLEERIAAIRAWLYQMEVDLGKPAIFRAVDTAAINEILQQHDRLQRSIEQQSSEVGEVLNLSEMLLSDSDTWQTHFNIAGLTGSVEQLEARWRRVCSTSAERKRAILSNWTLLQELVKLTEEHDRWVSLQEQALVQLAVGIDDVDAELTAAETEQRVRALESKLQDYELRAAELKIVEYTYAKLIRTSSGLQPDNIQSLTAPTKSLLVRWRQLEPNALELIGRLSMATRVYREFINCHGRAVVQLTQIDAELTRLQHVQLQPNAASSHPAEQQKSIAALEQELKTCEADLARADELGMIVMQNAAATATPTDIAPVQALIDEYQMLWRDIQTRIVVVRTEIVARVQRLHESTQAAAAAAAAAQQVQEADCAVDSAVQVNTLPGLSRMTSITPKDAYVYELEAAIRECVANLQELQQAVGDTQKRPGSQVVAKAISCSQSAVELMNHLSTLLVTECFCTSDEAQTVCVAELSEKYERLVAEWRARERVQQDSHR